ncbi:hypothetical protein Tco_0697430, partial [Tanacetum coccineum]
KSNHSEKIGEGDGGFGGCDDRGDVGVGGGDDGGDDGAAGSDGVEMVASV